VSEGIRTPGRWSHNPELYQLSYAHHETKCRRNNSMGRSADVVIYVRMDVQTRPVETEHQTDGCGVVLTCGDYEPSKAFLNAFRADGCVKATTVSSG
jgi:hypothetical protein